MNLHPSAPPGPSQEQVIERVAALAFAPLHKAAFGMGIGTAAALVLFLLTAAGLTLDPGNHAGLSLLSQFLTGYSETWAGAFIGAAWGFFIGFVAGWFFAFTRNLVLAIWLLIVRARAEMSATRDFLDHV